MATTPPAPAPDRGQAADFLRLIFNPDDVFEVRVLGANGRARHTAAGWFRGKDAARAAAKACEASAAGASGVYYTPNPCRRDCLSRAAGRLVRVRRDGDRAVPQPTEDVDVPARCWLVIDVDRKKTVPAVKVSATDAEKDALWKVAEDVRTLFAGHRWPAPLVVDSGNGFHLYYRLPEPLGGGPAPDDDLLAELLRRLNYRFEAAADVDRSVFNAGRILKLPGTVARKGPRSADRPHRLCKLLEAPGPDPAYDPAAATPLAEVVAGLAARPPAKGATSVAVRPASAGPGRQAPLDLTDAELVGKIGRSKRGPKFTRLWDGNTNGYDSGSEADLALASILMWWCQGDAARADRLFRSSGLMRPKWDTRRGNSTYGARTLARAGKGQGDGYDPTRDASVGPPPPADPAGHPGEAEAGSVGQPAGVEAHTEPPEPHRNESDTDPHRLARLILGGYTHPRGKTLAYWLASSHEWSAGRYKTVPDPEWTAHVNQVVHRQLTADHTAKLERYDPSGKDDPPKMPQVGVGLVANVKAALAGMTLVRGVAEAPAWLPGTAGPNPRDLVAARDGLVHLPDYAAGRADAIIPHTPRYLTFNALDYAPDPGAAEPAEWLRFLNDLWPDDPESVALLQEWFGYLLTPDTRQQKMLLLVGPTRAGKGVTLDVLKALVGAHNCCSPALTKLGRDFELADLLGKSVALITDAKAPSKADAPAVIERLKTISGGGSIAVNRKHKDVLTTRLATRFVVAANDLPDLDDSSGALGNRWCPLWYTKTFLGREDTGLTARLLAELPGIFNWAVAGWKRLQDQGRFTAPAASQPLTAALTEDARQVEQFLADRCELGAAYSVLKPDLFAAWEDWCRGQCKKLQNEVWFSRNLLLASGGKVKSERIRQTWERFYVYSGVRLVGRPGAESVADPADGYEDVEWSAA